MNLISISTDRKIFDPGSAVAQRMIEYGSLVSELHVVVFTGQSVKTGRSDTIGRSHQLSANVFAYATNSRSRFRYVFDARRIAVRIFRTNRHFSAANTVVTVQDPFETGLVGRFLKKRFGLALQVQIHTDFLSPYFATHSFLNRLRLRIARWVLPQADEIRVVSERIKRSLFAHPLYGRILEQRKMSVDVLAIFSDSASSHSGSGSDSDSNVDLHRRYPDFSKIILMCSRLAPEKNIAFALDVFKKILGDALIDGRSESNSMHTSNIGLVIVGGGPEKSHLVQQAIALGISNNVMFEGWNTDLAPYYKTCDLFLSTSFYEGYGLTLVEAGIQGAPVVTSDVGIVGELLVDGHNAQVCPVGDVECFRRKIEGLLADSAKSRALGDVLRDTVSRGLLSKEEYLKKYKMLLEKTRPAASL